MRPRCPACPFLRHGGALAALVPPLLRRSEVLSNSPVGQVAKRYTASVFLRSRLSAGRLREAFSCCSVPRSPRLRAFSWRGTCAAGRPEVGAGRPRTTRRTPPRGRCSPPRSRCPDGRSAVSRGPTTALWRAGRGAGDLYPPALPAAECPRVSPSTPTSPTGASCRRPRSGAAAAPPSPVSSELEGKPEST